MDLSNIKQIYDLCIWIIVGIIATAGFLFGGYSLWEGYMEDQPSSKKRGFIVVFATLFVLIFIILAKSMIWNMIASNQP